MWSGNIYDIQNLFTWIINGGRKMFKNPFKLLYPMQIERIQLSIN